MFRTLFVMVTAMVVGLGSGYALWGTRVARLTEALSGITLEIDTMRARLAAPRAQDGEPGPDNGAMAADQLRVINESLAAVRQDLADQKALIERSASTATAVAPGAASASADLRALRDELAGCLADKRDLEAMRGVATPPPNAAGTPPAYRPTAPPTYQPPAPRYDPPPAAAPTAPVAPPVQPAVPAQPADSFDSDDSLDPGY